MGTPLCDLVPGLKLLRDDLYLDGHVHKHSSITWFNEAVAHPSPDEFSELSFALAVAVLEPHDANDPSQPDSHQIFRMDIPLIVAHTRTCYDGSEVVTLVPKKHTVLLPSALASSRVVCTLTELQVYPRARFIGQIQFNLSDYAPWRQCIFVKQECGPAKHDLLPDSDSCITYRSTTDRGLVNLSSKPETKTTTARNNTIAFAVFPSSSITSKAGPAVELSTHRAAVAVRRRVWLVIIERVLAIYYKLGDYRPKQMFGLKGCGLAYDVSQGVVTLQQSTGKLLYILLTNDIGDWLQKLRINQTLNGSEANVTDSKHNQEPSFAALGELTL